MTPERWKKLEALFDEAVELEGDAREAFLATACGADEQLRAETERLIAAHERESDFIDSPIFKHTADRTEADKIESTIGRSIGPYRVVSLLGRGGMGVVYIAEDSRLGRKIAIKMLPAAFTRDQDRVRRFEREAKAASALNHPNIVTIHEIGEAEAGRFIVMELVEGRTLRALAREQISLTSLAQLGRQIAQALAAAHAAGIVHRDIKPENIMVRDDGYVKVLDFGLARLTPSSLVPPDAESLSNTNSGGLLGTARYMSPEQARGEDVSGSADIFSLGIVFYELATGQHPFPADSQLGALHAVISQTPLSPSHLNPEIWAPFEALILQMLEKEARLRPTATQVGEAITQLAEEFASKRARRPASPGAERHMVGRDKERVELRAGFESVAAGHGLLLCVSGEPGIGKTTLVEDFLTGLADGDQPCIIARGRCSERLAGTEAYLPLLEALDKLLHSHGGESSARVMKLLAPTWYFQIAPLSADNPDEARSIAETRAGSQERMKRELSAFLQEVSRFRPLVFFLDDLHWADASTVDLLAYLATKFETLRILILAAYRTTDLLLIRHSFSQVKLDLQGRGYCHDIALDFLSRKEIENYLALEFPDHQFPKELTTLIQTKTEGNPLFMVNLVRYLRDQKVIPEQGGEWALAQSVGEIERELPESIRSMIERKLEQLGETDRRLLAAASVQGYEFDSAVVAKALGMDANTVEERLQSLEQTHAFVKSVDEREFPDGTLTLRWRFVHVLYQNVLNASMQTTRRAALSAVMAEGLLAFNEGKFEKVASELANLFEMARDWRRASECFLLAARNAARVFADAESAALVERGLANVGRLPDSPDRSRLELRLQITLGAALMTINAYASSAVKQVYLRAEELCRRLVDNRQLFRVQFGLTIICTVRGEHERAGQLAQECAKLAEQMQDEELIAQAHWACGLSLQYPGAYGASLAHLEKAVGMGKSGEAGSIVSLQKKIAAVFSQGHLALLLLYLGWPDQAQAMKRITLTRQEEFAHPLSYADNLYHAAFIEVFHNRLEEVRELSETLLKYAAEQGLKWYSAIGLILRGWVAVNEGQTEEGLDQMRSGLDKYRATETKLSLTFYLALLADALSATGRREEGLAVLTEALSLAEQTNERYYEAELHRLKGELLLKAGPGELLVLPGPHAAQAETSYHRAIQISRLQGTRSFELRTVASLARLWRRQGKQAGARQALAEVYGRFTEGFDTPDLQEARALLDELA